MTIGLTLSDIRKIIDYLVSQSSLFKEPVTPFDECNHSKLITSLKTPFLRPIKGNSFHDLIEKASEVYYLLNVNHALINGNKRLSTHALLVLVNLNGYMLTMSEAALKELTLNVALMSHGKIHKDKITKHIRISIKSHMKKNTGISKEARAIFENKFIDFLVAHT